MQAERNAANVPRPKSGNLLSWMFDAWQDKGKTRDE